MAGGIYYYEDEATIVADEDVEIDGTVQIVIVIYGSLLAGNESPLRRRRFSRGFHS